jgi:hypothetical protein
VNLSRRNLLMLGALALGVIGVIYDQTAPTPAQVVSGSESPTVLENRLARLRKTAAMVPEKTAALQSISTILQTRERGILAFKTAPQAEAHLLEVVRRLASANKIAAGGGDFSPPTQLGTDYGQVTVTVTFESTIDAFVNFLADLSKEQELIAPDQVNISQGNIKAKTVNVRLVVAGVVPKKLVPEKKNVLSL